MVILPEKYKLSFLAGLGIVFT